MKKALTFIIPVRHQENAKNWPLLKSNLSETIRSIARQRSSSWKAVIVANEGADLPHCPEGFEIKRVTFPPNPLHEQGNSDLEEFRDAVRRDKGKRILAGMLHADEMHHVMIVDDDDFVSRNLVSFVEARPTANGWFIQNGYIWDGGKLLYLYPDFSHLCGSSHIVRAELYRLPTRFDDADDEYIRKMLGSHIFLADALAKEGRALSPLPFIGAVYRAGHAGSHSKSGKILNEFFLRKRFVRTPATWIRRWGRLRLMSKHIREEFFGAGPHAS